MELAIIVLIVLVISYSGYKYMKTGGELPDDDDEKTGGELPDDDDEK